MSNKDLLKKAMGNLSKSSLEKVYKEEREAEKPLIGLDVPVLNILSSGKIGGGIPMYQMSFLATPKAMGKTTAILKFLAKMQKKGFIPVYVETEGRYNEQLAIKCGLDVSKEKFRVFDQSNNINDVMNAIVQFFNKLDYDEQRQFAVGFDSWGALVSTTTMENAEAEKNTRNMFKLQERNELAKVIAGFKCTTLIAGWSYENIGTMGNTKKIAGGSGIEYMADVIIQGNSESKSDKSVKNATAKDDENSNITGKVVAFNTIKSSAGGMEDTKLKVRVLKDGGIDPYWGLMPDALYSGVVTQKGQKFTNTITGEEIAYEKNTYTPEFWIPIWKDKKFNDFITKKYSYDGKDMIINTFDLDSVLG